MSTPKISRSFRLAADVVEILDHADNATAFVEDAVRVHGTHARVILEQYERSWRSALAYLRGYGWTLPALRAACDALNGYWTEEGRPAAWIAQEFADAVGLAAKHDVDPDLWSLLIERVGGSEVEARAVLAVARAFWTGDPEVERALGVER